MNLPNGGEFGLIETIRRRVANSTRSSVRLGIGDDCAILSPSPNADWLVTTDMLMDGRHFRLDECGPEAAGYKALAVNLSDIAAMAARPVAAFVAVALPRARAVEIGRGLLDGMVPLAERFGVVLAGGDTNAWDGPLAVCVTLVGEAVPPGPILRSGARPGHVIGVTGPLGGSLLGRHLRPEPRIAEALALLEFGPPHALIDISDGLASDLGHILDESGGLGALLIPNAIPIHPDAEIMSRQDLRSPLDHALYDGEDFELCVVVDPETASRLQKNPPPGVRFHVIGHVTEEPGLAFLDSDGTRRPIERRGFDHFAEKAGP